MDCKLVICKEVKEHFINILIKIAKTYGNDYIN